MYYCYARNEWSTWKWKKKTHKIKFISGFVLYCFVTFFTMELLKKKKKLKKLCICSVWLMQEIVHWLPSFRCVILLLKFLSLSIRRSNAPKKKPLNQIGKSNGVQTKVFTSFQFVFQFLNSLFLWPGTNTISFDAMSYSITMCLKIGFQCICKSILKFHTQQIQFSNAVIYKTMLLLLCCTMLCFVSLFCIKKNDPTMDYY